MNKKILHHITSEHIFIGIASFVLFHILLSVLLTEFNLFYYLKISEFMLIICLLLLFVYLLYKRKFVFTFYREDIPVFFVIVFFCTLNVIFFHQTFFGGRDDGVYANAALYLVKHNTFFIKELNVASFPGFITTTKGIISQFYLGYSVWIASIISYFGIDAISFVNVPLLLIGFISIYYICKNIENWFVGLLTVFLTSLSYPFFWFTRKTFSENLAFMLTWFGLFCLMTGYKTKQMRFFFLSLISINILLIVRIESIPLTIIVLAIVLFTYFKYQLKSSFVFLIFVIIASLFPAIFYYLNFDPRYITIIHSEFSNFLINIINKIHHTHSVASIAIDKTIIEYHQPELVFFLLQLFNIYFFIIMIPIFAVKSFFNSTKQKKLYYWFILLFLLPNLYFILKPSINFDLPWFLRRFMPVIIPTGFIAFSIVIAAFGRKLQMLLISLIIISSIIVASPIIFFKEYGDVTKQLTNNFNNTFKTDDLILVDYENTGHYKVAEPLFFILNYNTVAVMPYSINQWFSKEKKTNQSLYSDKAFQVNAHALCSYKNLFVLTIPGKQNILTNIIDKENIIPVKDYTLKYDELIKTCELFRITNKTTLEEMANVSLDAAENYCNTVPNTIWENIIKLRLVKIDKNFFNSVKKNNCYYNKTI